MTKAQRAALRSAIPLPAMQDASDAQVAMPATAAKPAAAIRHSRGPPAPALATERLAPPSRRTVSLGLRIARAQ
ncbi:hypothetical protein [Burkholderia pseudomallei]|uniref:hypothetical protein n=1 Tax=Burkholderia pseudomallei TaxID=28450 RepID=UPI000617938E|nr:hypothetical protein [Burkholderia pseudomallei]KKB68250.1 hypothetical protein BBMA_4718 [Burkholderia pseudomallei MSHR1079]